MGVSKCAFQSRAPGREAEQPRRGGHRGRPHLRQKAGRRAPRGCAFQTCSPRPPPGAADAAGGQATLGGTRSPKRPAVIAPELAGTRPSPSSFLLRSSPAGPLGAPAPREPLAARPRAAHCWFARHQLLSSFSWNQLTPRAVGKIPKFTLCVPEAPPRDPGCLSVLGGSAPWPTWGRVPSPPLGQKEAPARPTGGPLSLRSNSAFCSRCAAPSRAGAELGSCLVHSDVSLPRPQWAAGQVC